MKKRSGFTLIEMMAVVVIIGILAAVIGPKIFGNVDKANRTRAKQDVAQLVNTVTMFRLDTNQLPQSLRDLNHEPDGVKNWNGPYLKKNMIKDPWENNYEYRVPGNNGREFDIWSNGSDGQEGGEGKNADIVSWDEESD